MRLFAIDVSFAVALPDEPITVACTTSSVEFELFDSLVVDDTAPNVPSAYSSLFLAELNSHFLSLQSVVETSSAVPFERLGYATTAFVVGPLCAPSEGHKARSTSLKVFFEPALELPPFETSSLGLSTDLRVECATWACTSVWTVVVLEFEKYDKMEPPVKLDVEDFEFVDFAVCVDFSDDGRERSPEVSELRESAEEGHETPFEVEELRELAVEVCGRPFEVGEPREKVEEE